MTKVSIGETSKIPQLKTAGPAFAICASPPLGTPLQRLEEHSYFQTARQKLSIGVHLAGFGVRCTAMIARTCKLWEWWEESFHVLVCR